MSFIGISPSDIVAGTRIVARGLKALKEDGGSEDAYRHIAAGLRARLAAIKDLEELASSSQTPRDSSGMAKSLSELREREQERLTELHKYEPDLVQHAPGRKRNRIGKRLKFEFQGSKEAQNYNQKSVPGVDAAVINAILLGIEQSRQHNSQIQRLIIDRSSETAQEMLTQSSHLEHQLQDAFSRLCLASEVLHHELLHESVRTREELKYELKTSIQSIMDQSTLLSPLNRLVPEHQPRSALQSGSKKLVPNCGTWVTQDEFWRNTPNSSADRELSNAPVGQWRIEGYLTIILLAMGAASASQFVREAIQNPAAQTHHDLLTMITLSLVTSYFIRGQMRLPAQISLISDSCVHFEDPFGSNCEIPFLQCEHFEIFCGFLRVYFKNRPGLQRVVRQQFLLTLEGRRPRVIEKEEWSHTLKPRSRITMHMGVVDSASCCPRCLNALKSSTAQLLYCGKCNEDYIAATFQDSAELDELEELQDETRSEIEADLEELRIIRQEDHTRNLSIQNLLNSAGSTQIVHKSQVNRPNPFLEGNAVFRHIALPLSESRNSAEESEQEFMAYNYPEGKWPVLQNTDLYRDQIGLGNLQHLLLEKLDYCWNSSSVVVLDTQHWKKVQLSTQLSQPRLLKRFKGMSRSRRAQVYQLLNQYNAEVREPGCVYYVTYMATTRSRIKRMEDGSQRRLEVFCMEVVIQQVKVQPTVLFRWENVPSDREALSAYHEFVEGKVSSDVFGRISIQCGPGRLIIRNGMKYGGEGTRNRAVHLRQNDTLEFLVEISFTDKSRNNRSRVVAVVEYAGVPGRKARDSILGMTEPSERDIDSRSDQNFSSKIAATQTPRNTTDQGDDKDLFYDIDRDILGLGRTPPLVAVNPAYDSRDTPPPLVSLDPYSESSDSEELTRHAWHAKQRRRQGRAVASFADGVLIASLDPGYLDTVGQCETEQEHN